MHKLITKSIMAVALLTSLTATAQTEESVKVTPTGRILMDGGAYHSNNDLFVNGVAMPDCRIGVKASYGQYKAKVDLGYAYGKVSLKDIFVERKFSESTLLRVGNFVHQFGLQSSTSSSMKVTMEEPTSNEAFFNSRLLGAMVIYDKGAFFGAGSVHAESAALKKATNELGSTGYGAMTRLVYRPFRETGAIFHVGLSAAYEKPRYNSAESLNHSSFVLGANFPTRIAKVRALNAVVTDANHLVKFTPELTAAYGPVGLETQYFYVQVNKTKGLPTYKASGAYATLRGLILGGDYKYSHADSGIATPQPGSLEAVLSYNYTDMSDAKAAVYGGRLNDVSFTVNYYLNKYMIWRFRYAYSDAKNRLGLADDYLSAFQTRFQIIF